MKRLAGIVLVISFIIFFIGVSQPVVGNVFNTDVAAEQLQYMQESPDQWQFGNLMMGIGGIITAVGIGIFAVVLRQNNTDQQLLVIGYASAVTGVVAAIVWMFICYNRFALPPEQVAGNQDITAWGDPVYTLSVMVSILLMGYIIMQRYAKWVGVAMILIEVALSALSFFAFGSVAPAIHFLPIGIAGLVLVFASGKQVPQSASSITTDLQSQLQ